ncbi:MULTISPECIES: methionine ABC transporter permease [unclassified Crossiella]|uniref:methionine ABC transporter permease n=1 Tax=unclassified Crossiella TaxID=2620835 RepID=UPI001FFFBA82|nr:MULTISPECIES: methionine ABC transporter permease [unclassified Crossiella]MCK2237017.1 ABC transporter permease [Crossiella sp. S99.2]MCK2250685.1 ABC transporter permease [Crossiella sp. S99.1]
MKQATPWAEVFDKLAQAGAETGLMVGLGTLFAVLGGVPLGVLLHASAPGGLRPQPLIYRVLGFIVDLTRSLPFIILLVALIPLTRALVGSYIGSGPATVPLTIGAIPFLARLVQSALREVPVGVVEAALTTGASKPKIVRSVLVKEAGPALISAIGVTAVALIGYSAMAGAVGGGGLGNLAITYGYQRFDSRLLYTSVAALAALTFLVQYLFDLVSRTVDRRRQITV